MPYKLSDQLRPLTPLWLRLWLPDCACTSDTKMSFLALGNFVTVWSFWDDMGYYSWKKTIQSISFEYVCPQPPCGWPCFQHMVFIALSNPHTQLVFGVNVLSKVQLESVPSVRFHPALNATLQRKLYSNQTIQHPVVSRSEKSQCACNAHTHTQPHCFDCEGWAFLPLQGRYLR